MTKHEILELLKEIKPDLKKKYHIKNIILFGSFARNEATENSDIDLTYELEENQYISFSDFEELEELFFKNFKRKIELINQKYMNPLIKKTAKKDFIYV